MSCLYENINLDCFLNEVCSNPEKIQENVLMDILENNASSELALKWDFASIKNSRDFSENVPVCEWEDFEPYAQKCREGKKNVMFPGEPELFIITSGTTGDSKLIPESKDSISIKRNISNLRFEAIREIRNNVFDKKILPVTNNGEFGKTEHGVPYGSASGVTLNTASEQWLKKLAFPIEIMKVIDPDSLDFLRMRFALEHDVSIIIGNNAARIKHLFELVENRFSDIVDAIEEGVVGNIDIPNDIEGILNSYLKPDKKRAAELRKLLNYKKITPDLYWRGLSVISCWLAGSVGRYSSDLKKYLPDSICLWDCGYGATESKFNIPLRPSDPSGPLTVHSAYYEFIDTDNPDRILKAHQLEKNKIYEILCTTYSGLFRYRMHDLITVTGFSGKTPEIKFESKSGDVINICGEKISAFVLIDAVLNSIKDTGIETEGWCVAPDFENKKYLFYIEPVDCSRCNKADALMFAEAVQKHLCANDILPYGLFCRQNLLSPAAVRFMKKGWIKAWMNELHNKKGLGVEQIKLPICVKTLPLPEYTDESIKYE